MLSAVGLQAPCVALPCGHTFHMHCVQARLEAGWPNSRIDFGHLDCPVCRAPLCELPKCEQQPATLESLITLWTAAKHAPVPPSLQCIEQALLPQLELQGVLILRALNQAERDGLDRDEAVRVLLGCL